MNAQNLESLIGRGRNIQQNNPVKDWVKDEFLTDNNKKKRKLLQRADDFNEHFNRKPMDKDSDIYKNKTSVYVKKLNNKDIKFPKKATLEYYEINLTTKREHIKDCIIQNPYLTKHI